MTSTESPNILWICTDQQRFDTLGCYGNEFVNTPNIDRLAQRGTTFERCYSQSPMCAPSRASFLTGRYPRTTGCRQNGQPIDESERPVTKLLAEHGYNCGLAGKLHINPCNPEVTPIKEDRIDDGYAEFHWSHDTKPAWPTNEYFQWLDERGVQFEQEPFGGSEHVQTSVPIEHHQTTWCIEKARSFIENGANYDAPWLFSVNIYDPHHPFDPPEEYLERYLDDLEDIPLPNYEDGELESKPIFQQRDHEGAYHTPGKFPYPEMDDEDHRLVRAAYWAMVDAIDDQVGRLLTTLEETGQLEDTIVIFMSDHGEMLGDHGIYLKGAYFYEPAIRVPLIISCPGTVEEDLRSNALVELTDIAPTLLDAVGVDVPGRMQGQSLWPLLTGETDSDTHRDSVYCEYYNAQKHHTDPRAYATMIRTDEHKLVSFHGLDQGELYDLAADPAETENLWADPDVQDLKGELLKEMTDRMAFTVDPLPERETFW